jgi:hypothetical protein
LVVRASPNSTLAAALVAISGFSQLIAHMNDDATEAGD